MYVYVYAYHGLCFWLQPACRYVYMCVCMCMYVRYHRLCFYVCLWEYVCTCMYMHITDSVSGFSLHVCMCMCVYIHVYIFSQFLASLWACDVHIHTHTYIMQTEAQWRACLLYMYACICMNVCTYVCMHVCMYVCMYVCFPIKCMSLMYVCMYVCMQVCISPIFH
jgi:hypothetical protein